MVIVATASTGYRICRKMLRSPRVCINTELQECLRVCASSRTLDYTHGCEFAIVYNVRIYVKLLALKICLWNTRLLQLKDVNLCEFVPNCGIIVNIRFM